MKDLRLIGIVLMLLTFAVACSGNKENNQKNEIKSSEELHVYYFHNERRCPTCKAVESESQKVVKDLYGEDVKFSAFNLETPEGEKKAEQIGVSGQSLLIVGKGKKIDITGDAFMYAKSNPEKLKQIIKDNIDPLTE